jgi:hypothetical protein
MALGIRCRRGLADSGMGDLLLLSFSPRLEVLWADLTKPDAVRASYAVCRLVLTPGQSVVFLRERLRPAKVEQVARLIADLDSERYAVREAATRAFSELDELGSAWPRVLLRPEQFLGV